MRIDKNGKEITKTMSYGLQFIDITRFMASSLSNLPEGIHKVKCISSNKRYLEYTSFWKFKKGICQYKEIS